MPELEEPRCPVCRNVTRTCLGCGAEVRVFASRVARWRYCSKGCRSIATAKLDHVAARFWAKVDRSGGPDACWPWLAGRHERGGYGQFRMPPALGGLMVVASRLAWVLTFGPIADGLWVLHRCDNPPCCNPAHCFLGDNSTNQLDSIAKGRHAASRPEYHSNSRLTPEVVAALRATHAAGGWTFKRLGERFGVDASTARNVVRELVWKVA